MRVPVGEVSDKTQRCAGHKVNKFVPFSRWSNSSQPPAINSPALSAKNCDVAIKDRAQRSAPEIRYEQPELLGFIDIDLDIIRDALLTKPTQ